MDNAFALTHKEIRTKMEEYYMSEGLTERVIELSQELDKHMVKLQRSKLEEKEK